MKRIIQEWIIPYIFFTFCILSITLPVNADEQVSHRYKFSLTFKGLEEADFQIITINIGSNRTDVQAETREGKIFLSPGKTTYFNLSIRRYLNPNDELGHWRKQITQGKFVRRDGTIQVLDETEETVMEFSIKGAWPSEQRIDAFPAVQSQVMETLTFVAEKITRNK
jgi:phage tail-like protein